MKKLLALAVVCLLTLLGVQGTAHAILLPQYDLTSLSFQADNVVRARQTSEKKVDQYTTLRTMVVTQNYKGNLAAGATFTVTYDEYSTAPYGRMWGEKPNEKEPVLGAEIVLFMVRPRLNHYEGARGDFAVVSSGLRIFLDGKAQRFGQVNNPGGYYPFPQGLDPWDMRGDPRATRDVDLAGLEAQMAVALRRAAEVKRAMLAPDTPESRRFLARLAGDLGDWAEDPEFSNDAIGGPIVEELAKRRDLPALLDAVARARFVRYSWTEEGHAKQLVDAAENTALPVTSRVAALHILAEHDFYFRDGAYDPRLIAFFSDPNPAIREAAFGIRTTEKTSPALKSAIRARWAAEKVDLVRIAIAAAAVGADMRSELAAMGTTWPLVGARVRGEMIVLTWLDIDEKVHFDTKNVHFTGKRAGATRAADLTVNLSMVTGAGRAVIGAPLVFDPALAAGTWDATAEFTLEDDGAHHRPVTKTFNLGTILAPPPLVVPPPVTAAAFPIDVAEAAPPPPVVTVDAGAPLPFGPPAPEKKRSACGCDVVRSEGGASSFAALGAIALLLLARRSRAHLASQNAKRDTVVLTRHS